MNVLVVLILCALAVLSGWLILRDANTAITSTVQGWPETEAGEQK